MDVGAVKAPTIQRSYPCRRSRQSVSTSPSRSSRFTELMHLDVVLTAAISHALDDRVEAGDVAAARENADAFSHHAHLLGMACRNTKAVPWLGEAPGGGGGQISGASSMGTGGPGSSAKSSLFSEEKPHCFALNRAIATPNDMKPLPS